MKNIIFIGSMGSGKTSIGKRLAEMMELQFLDTDELIVNQEGKSISEIFSEQGEERFRKMETDLLAELEKREDTCIISTGGGMPVRRENRELLQKLGHVFFLQASKDTLLKRLHGDTKRPMLSGGNMEKKLEELLMFRTPLYRACAHTIIDTNDKSMEQVINEVQSMIKNIIGQ